MRLEPVNPKNWRTDVRVAESQRHYAADKATLPALAYAYRDENSRAYFLYKSETAVGMGLYYDCPELDAYEFNQFFIDQRFQERGLGLAGAKLLLGRCAGKGNIKRSFCAASRGTPPPGDYMRSLALRTPDGSTATKSSRKNAYSGIDSSNVSIF